MNKLMSMLSDATALWCLDVDERKKNVSHVLMVPNGTSTFSELENQKNQNVLMRTFRGH